MITPLLTPEQRNGRQLLVLALTLLGAIPLGTFFIQGSGVVVLVACMAVYSIVLFFAYQGGQIALGLLKGLALLMALVFTILLMTLAIWHFGGGNLPPDVRPHRSPLEIAAPAFTAYFALWALFLSKSVKAFLRARREQRASTLENPS